MGTSFRGGGAAAGDKDLRPTSSSEVTSRLLEGYLTAQAAECHCILSLLGLRLAPLNNVGRFEHPTRCMHGSRASAMK